MARFPAGTTRFSTLPRHGSCLTLVLIVCAVATGSATAQAPVQPPASKAEKPAPPPADKPGQPPDSPAEEEPPTEPPPPVRFFEQDPFDQIVLDKANDYAVLKVLPLDLPNRRLPDSKKRVGKLRVRLIEKPKEEYDVAWKNIERIEFFEELVLRETDKIVAQAVELSTTNKLSALLRKFDEAFDYYQFLWKYYPQTQGLAESSQGYLYANAGVLFKQQRVAEAFAILEELYQQNKDYQHPGGSQTVKLALERVGERLVRDSTDTGSYQAARLLLERLERDYGDALKFVGTWRERLQAAAAKKRDEAMAHLAAKRFREAHQVSREMLQIWPRVEGGHALVVDVARQYPLIMVGVAQPALTFDPERLDDWSARRAGALVYETMLKFTARGPEGGQYACPFGTVEQSEDRRQLRFDIRPNQAAQGLTGFALASYLLSLADPQSPGYRPAWASLMAGIQQANPNRVVVDLRRPFVLPQALLQARLTSGGEPLMLYRAVSQNDQEARFEPVSSGLDAAKLKPVIVEQLLPEPRKALDALRKGKVDVLDHLLPVDALRLQQDPTLVVGPYGFPTIHVLVPNLANPFLASRIFRRALVYGINREVILRKGLLNSLSGADLEGCRVLSAPLPAGLSENDPSAYAYDARITPLPYDPVMATVLLKLTEQQLAVAADTRKQPAPELKELVLAHPAGEIPRFVCQKIRANLDGLGVKCALRELPPGQVHDPKKAYDLLYLELIMYEPLVDAGRIFGPAGALPTADPYVNLALRQIERSDNWKVARERLQDLHRLLYEDVSVIPLWQMVDFFAYQRGLQGLPNRPVFFYQDVDQWRVIPPAPQE